MTIYELIANPAYKNKHVLQMLLMHHLGIEGKDEIIRKYDDEIAQEALTKIEEGYHAYTEGNQPLEYVLWYVEFFGRRFHVNQYTLIPRPETEYMIASLCEEVAKVSGWKGWKEDAMHSVLVDVGTGCGVLGTSCFLENPEFFEEVYLTELSEDALEVARKNVQTLVTDEKRSQVEFFVWDLLASLTSPPAPLLQGEGRNIRIVANLPYIPDETFDTQTDSRVHDNEPRMAFVGGDDGLDLYRRMFKQVQEVSKVERGKKGNLVMFLEMMTWQVDILRKEFDWLEFEEVKTFHFQIRIVKATVK